METATEETKYSKCGLLHGGIALPRHAIFCKLVSMSTSGSVYVLFIRDMFFHYHFHFRYS